MNLRLFATAAEANRAAADLLLSWLVSGSVRNLMAAAGNTPLELYRLVGERKPSVASLNVFALDEYVGVPLDEPRNCANLIRRTLAQPWGIPPDRFFTVSSLETEALASVQRHEQLIQQHGGLDVIILGLGQNGHLGFNEPGSEPGSVGRVLNLEPISVEANRQWFQNKYAPNKGVTVGLKTILSARRVIILAYGPHKTAAVNAMIKGPVGPHSPASFLQLHPEVHVFLDQPAAAGLVNT